MSWTLRLALAIALGGCKILAGSDPDAAPSESIVVTPEQCEANFDMAFARPCATPSDCVLMVHSDCCHEIYIGVAQSELAAAMAAQEMFNACIGPACGGRGCGGQTSAEDGRIPAQGESIVATCVSNMCTSTVQ